MRILALFLLLSFNVYSQRNTLIVATPNAAITTDSDKSYIYCATMEIMWNELRNYLDELPQTKLPNETVKLLNESIRTNYSAPIEDKFVVAKAGLVSDSITDKIRLEHKQKFNQTWHPFNQPSNSAILAYAYLQNDVRFRSTLDDKFDEVQFQKDRRVDCFGVKLGDPNRERTDILIYDYINSDNFILQVKSRDSLDEIYFAKSPKGGTLLEMYKNTIARVDQKNVEAFTGNDILIIPYIEFDTTKRYSDIENSILTNELAQSRNFQSVLQRISFDLNPEGIKLQSRAASIIDFADFEYEQKPRFLAFNDPFLIIMKRKNSAQPYFLYWVANTEFMREYVLTKRDITEEERPFVGTWQFSTITTSEITRDFWGEQFITLESDGTCLINRNRGKTQGIWEYSDDSIRIDFSEYPNRKGFDLNWKVEGFDSEQLTILHDQAKIQLLRSTNVQEKR